MKTAKKKAKKAPAMKRVNLCDPKTKMPRERPKSPKWLHLAVERCSEATPGPWEARPDSRPDVVNPVMVAMYKRIDDAAYQIWAAEGEPRPVAPGFWGEGQLARAMHKYPGHVAELAKYELACADADFIAMARNVLPWLLDQYHKARLLVRWVDGPSATEWLERDQQGPPQWRTCRVCNALGVIPSEDKDGKDKDSRCYLCDGRGVLVKQEVS
jgi:hypothetical protein